MSKKTKEATVESKSETKEATVESNFVNSTKELMIAALSLWKLRKTEPMMYIMTRTFCHHRIGEKYDTGRIFAQLEKVGNGNHDQLMKEMDEFSEMVLSDLDDYLAKTGSTD